MKMKRTLMSAMLAALPLGAATPALAQQAAGVTLSQPVYRLVDLAPDDGIAPSLGWSGNAALAYASVYDQEGNEIANSAVDGFGAAGFDNAYAAARANTDGNSASVLLALYSGYGYASANRSFNFTLSPHTQVIFNVDAGLWASPEAPGQSGLTALAELYGSLHGVGNGDWTFATRAQLDQGSQQGTLSVSAISGDAWIDGYLAFNAYAVAESHALPVPEPATSLMLLAGIGLIGLVRRR